MRRLLFVMWCLVLAGCATAPTSEQLAMANYGTPIEQADAEQRAKNYLQTALKDPYSAQIRWAPVERGWMREAPIHGGALKFGYILNAGINAKNSYGGYTGEKAYRFLFINGNLESVYGESTEYIGGQRTTIMKKMR
jgi:hypothetical protein